MSTVYMVLYFCDVLINYHWPRVVIGVCCCCLLVIFAEHFYKVDDIKNKDNDFNLEIDTVVIVLEEARGRRP